MWLKWFPWRFLVRSVARRRGFLDPIKILSQIENFAQPSEVLAPIELLRLSVVLHARGLMNSLAIQNNLDWIWPYWVERQYNPQDVSFIPRSFSLTQINLTHRNWTALGVPDGDEFTLVDPRGLVTPYYDSWSVDAWVIPFEGKQLIPSRLEKGVTQKLVMEGNLSIITESLLEGNRLLTKTRVIGPPQSPVCQIQIKGFSPGQGQLVISLRPYNSEGVSFIHDISLLEDQAGWQINKKNFLYFDKLADQTVFSDYRRGDVYSCCLLSLEKEKMISDKVGMASAAAIFLLEPGKEQEINITIPLKAKTETTVNSNYLTDTKEEWAKSLKGTAALQIPDKHFQFLYETAVQSMILHSPKDVYPGPYIYRRFWFRDAAFILYAMLFVGLKERVRRALDRFRLRQTARGYFFSQEGEWDSNGQALWIMLQYCQMTASLPPKEWKKSIIKAGKWIYRKRLQDNLEYPHAGLLPSGFSAEHLGPNDYYYWDDFWSIAGLRAAAIFSAAYQDNDAVLLFENDANALLESVNKSLKQAQVRIRRPAMPASVYRRMDSGAIGSLSASHPLRIYSANDPRVLDTVEFLMKSCLINGGFFHDMTHSGINPYLSLHLAQVLLRAGDPRYLGLMTRVAELASPTGQWPESIHPATGGGCMGDGQHIWASAEWVLMIRNLFVREEEGALILCSGIPQAWLAYQEPILFGPAPTSFGDISIAIKPSHEEILIEWSALWFAKTPQIEIRMPGFAKIKADSGANRIVLKRI